MRVSAIVLRLESIFIIISVVVGDCVEIGSAVVALNGNIQWALIILLYNPVAYINAWTQRQRTVPCTLRTDNRYRYWANATWKSVVWPLGICVCCMSSWGVALFHETSTLIHPSTVSNGSMLSFSRSIPFWLCCRTELFLRTNLPNVHTHRMCLVKDASTTNAPASWELAIHLFNLLFFGNIFGFSLFFGRCLVHCP